MVVAVVVAAAVVAAAVVAVAAVVVAAESAGLEAAAHPGVGAAGAKRGHLPRVIDANIMAGFDIVDPAYACVLSVSSQRLC